jgi:hypothetical protein
MISSAVRAQDVPLIYLLRRFRTVAALAVLGIATGGTAVPDAGLIGPPCNASTACGIGNGFLGIRNVSVDKWSRALNKWPQVR